MPCLGINHGIIAAEASYICLSRQCPASSGQLISPPDSVASYDTQRQLASPRRPCAYRRAVKPALSALRAACPLCAQITTPSDEARPRRACRTSARRAQNCKIARRRRWRSRPTSPRRRGRFYYIIVSSTTASAKGSIQKAPASVCPSGCCHEVLSSPASGAAGGSSGLRVSSMYRWTDSPAAAAAARMRAPSALSGRIMILSRARLYLADARLCASDTDIYPRSFHGMVSI